MKQIFIFLFSIPFFLFSQTEEKRLALVIGNSNYDKGPLNNPVNDALLMAKTLESLDFDVILDTNIAIRGEFLNTIREFGNKRSDYDVAFVYYAGHGIQVGAENFLLPTKVNFETEYDVMDNAVSVQNIMRYLTGMTNQVNILVLDACRDNPFEGNWNKTRSLKGGGLAKIPPPTGSLIAFSTDAGNTASDGDGKNSVYCQSLCENMMLENTSLDQVFRNVRSDVLKITNGNQRPVESSQLTGSTFYLKSLSSEFLLKKINEYIYSNNYEIADQYINNFIYNFPESEFGYLKKAQLYQINNKIDIALINYKKAIQINHSLDEIYYCRISNEISHDGDNIIGLETIFYRTNEENWKDIFQKYINNNKLNPIANLIMGRLHYHFDIQKSKYFFQKAIDYNDMNLSLPHILDNSFSTNQNSNTSSLFNECRQWMVYVLTRQDSLDEAEKLAVQIINESKSNYEKAIAISSVAEIYQAKNNFIKAIDFYKKATQIHKDPVTYSFLSDLCFDIYLADSINYVSYLTDALFYINEAIKYSKKNSSLAFAYANRANIYYHKGNIIAALKDYEKSNQVFSNVYGYGYYYAILQIITIYNDYNVDQHICNFIIELKKIYESEVYDNETYTFIEEEFKNIMKIDIKSFKIKDCSVN